LELAEDEEYDIHDDAVLLDMSNILDESILSQMRISQRQSDSDNSDNELYQVPSKASHNRSTQEPVRRSLQKTVQPRSTSRDDEDDVAEQSVEDFVPSPISSPARPLSMPKPPGSTSNSGRYGSAGAASTGAGSEEKVTLNQPSRRLSQRYSNASVLDDNAFNDEVIRSGNPFARVSSSKKTATPQTAKSSNQRDGLHPSSVASNLLSASRQSFLSYEAGEESLDSYLNRLSSTADGMEYSMIYDEEEGGKLVLSSHASKLLPKHNQSDRQKTKNAMYSSQELDNSYANEEFEDA
jgi:hypothetical protein